MAMVRKSCLVGVVVIGIKIGKKKKKNNATNLQQLACMKRHLNLGCSWLDTRKTPSLPRMSHECAAHIVLGGWNGLDKFKV